MRYKNSPGAYPVARFPSGSITPKSSRAWDVTVKASSSVILECTAFEAARTTGEIVGATVSSSAVPVTRSNIRAGGEPKWGATPPTIATKVTWPRFPATLAGVPPLEVEVLAWPTVPISWPAHVYFYSEKTFNSTGDKQEQIKVEMSKKTLRFEVKLRL